MLKIVLFQKEKLKKLDIKLEKGYQNTSLWEL